MPGPTEDNQYVTQFDRFLDWGKNNVWGTPEPRWYDDMSVDQMQPGVKEDLLAYEAQNPYDRRPYMVQHMDNAGRMLGGAAQGMAEMIRPTPKPTLGGKLMGEAIASGQRLDDAARTKRLDAEMALIDILMQELQRPPAQVPTSPQSAPPPGFGTSAMPDYAQFQGESQQDPEIQRQMEQKRFQDMMAMRGRPLPPPTE